MNITALRLNNYDADDAGRIICQREPAIGYGNNVPARHMRNLVGVIRIDSTARELVDAVLLELDEPAALCGRKRDGSAILLFRVGDHQEQRHVTPNVPGHIGNTFELALRTGEPVTITVQSIGEVVDVGSWSWGKNRSPLEVSRTALPRLTPDIGALAIETAFKLGCGWAGQIRQEQETAARTAAAGPVVEESETDRIQREQEELVAANEGKIIGQSDGIFGDLILSARRAVAWRKKKASEAA